MPASVLNVRCVYSKKRLNQKVIWFLGRRPRTDPTERWVSSQNSVRCVDAGLQGGGLRGRATRLGGGVESEDVGVRCLGWGGARLGEFCGLRVWSVVCGVMCQR